MHEILQDALTALKIFLNPASLLVGIIIVALTGLVLYCIFGRDKKPHSPKGGD